jgi:hypothetical protein
MVVVTFKLVNLDDICFRSEIGWNDSVPDYENEMTPLYIWQTEQSHSIFYLIQECKQNGAAPSDIWLKSVR